MIFVNDVFRDMGGEHSRSELWLYVPDWDALFKRAIEAGATPKMPPMDMFWATGWGTSSTRSARGGRSRPHQGHDPPRR